MSTQTEQSFAWLRKIPGDLIELDEKPLVGFPPVFSWEQFSSELNRSLQTTGILVVPGEIQWRTPADLFSGLGDKLRGISLAVTPLSGNIWWVMPESGIVRFMETLLTKTPETPTTEDIDTDFLKAFTQFLTVEAIGAYEKVAVDKKLSPVILRSSDLPAESCLCLDLTIKVKDQTTYGRLFLSPTFRKAWAQRYLQSQQKLALESPIADSLDIIVHLEAGRINLKPSEWKQLTIGDYVLIDSCSLDPDEEKGRVMLVVNGTPCFRAKIKQGSLKILEHPLYHEVDKAMANPPPKNQKGQSEEEHFDEDAFDDSDLDAELDEDKPDDSDDSDAIDDTDDEDFELSDEDLEDKKQLKPAGASPTKPSSAAPSKAPAAAAPKGPISTTPLSVDEIPLSVVIEVGRLQMSVKKLLELQPGSMLELDIHPESGVDMVVNGKRIARGELLRIGDALGIRVTELS